jgi:hypothetical protein
MPADKRYILHRPDTDPLVMPKGTDVQLTDGWVVFRSEANGQAFLIVPTSSVRAITHEKIGPPSPERKNP